MSEVYEKKWKKFVRCFIKIMLVFKIDKEVDQTHIWLFRIKKLKAFQRNHIIKSISSVKSPLALVQHLSKIAA